MLRISLSKIKIYTKNITKFQKKGIKLHLGFVNFNKILNIKVDYCINSISGIDGLNQLYYQFHILKIF